MGSFTKISGGVAAVAITGAALLAAPVAARAQPMASGLGAIGVPCDVAALTAAINNANANGGGVLELAANCDYDITTSATAGDGLPIITGRVTINGAGATSTMIDRDAVALFRVLEVASGGNLILSNVLIENGDTSGLGGGVLNAGTLTVTSATFTGNTASNGGAVENSAGATASVANSTLKSNTATSVGGGAVINFGTLNVSGTSVKGNHAPINGGGLNTQPAGVSRISSSSFLDNSSGSLGGGMSNLGTTILTGTEVRHNSGSSGGGIATGNANVTLHGSIVQDNTPDNCNPLNTIPGCHG
jgi:hypothetical protein